MDPFIVRNMTYGIEDSLISTTGMIVGISAYGASKRDVLVSGSILVMVEALSMAFGAFLSEESFMRASGIPASDAWKYGTVMLLSYVLAGMIPLSPYAMSLKNPSAWATGLALVGLYALTYFTGRSHADAASLVAIGGAILGISIYVGLKLQHA